MSLKKIMLVVSVVGISSVPAMAQTLAFGATQGRPGVNDRITTGANIVSGPVLVDSNACLGLARTGEMPACTTAPTAPAVVAATDHNQQDFELKISDLQTLAEASQLRNQSVFFVQGQLTGAVFAVDTATVGQGSTVDLDTGETANAGYSATFVNEPRIADDPATEPNEATPTDGGPGESQFRVRVTLAGPADATANPLSSIGINLPIRFAGCQQQSGGASVQIEILASTGTAPDITAGSSIFNSGDFNLIQCFDPLGIQVASDINTGNSQLALGDRMRFNPGVGGPAELNADADLFVEVGNADTANQGTVGLITLTRTAPANNAAVLTSLGRNTDANEILNNSQDYSGMSAQLTLSGASQSADLRQIRAGFGTPGVVAGLSSFAYADSATTGASATATINYPAGVLENVVFSTVPFIQGLVIDLASVANAEETLLSTAVGAADIAVNYANGRDSKTILTGATDSVALDALDPQLATCGEFDRVGDDPQPFNTEIRITGHAGTSGVVAYMRNSSAGLAQQTANLAVDNLNNPSVVITQAQLTSAFGNFGNADFTLGFVGITTPASLDCDRLSVFENRDNVLVPFGNDRIQVFNRANRDGDD